MSSRLKLSYDCLSFHVRLDADVTPSPDVLDDILKRFVDAVKECATIPVAAALEDDDD